MNCYCWAVIVNEQLPLLCMCVCLCVCADYQKCDMSCVSMSTVMRSLQVVIFIGVLRWYVYRITRQTRILIAVRIEWITWVEVIGVARQAVWWAATWWTIRVSWPAVRIFIRVRVELWLITEARVRTVLHFVRVCICSYRAALKLEKYNNNKNRLTLCKSV